MLLNLDGYGTKISTLYSTAISVQVTDGYYTDDEWYIDATMDGSVYYTLSDTDGEQVHKVNAPPKLYDVAKWADIRFIFTRYGTNKTYIKYIAGYNAS